MCFCEMTSAYKYSFFDDWLTPIQEFYGSKYMLGKYILTDILPVYLSMILHGQQFED